ncbi:copper resistance protein CopC [Dactylosporangium sucinum]|uniref:CopC domain-containing protein n=1 Tax=Dactylosporangium sucinum TaxID=1424081 RepID=A0A917UCD7_9ACTN|nr:copper resistance CopC family protein [Dactylosporangium sucinum]GGM77154.1 hypothetical protein GCM10007977_093290 [Dactylosporangium sucinum]
MRLPVTVRALLAAAAAATLLLLAPAQPAWAHAKLLRTDPADGATVTAPVAAVTFTFNEMVQQRFSTVVVTGADGASYSDGAPRSVDKTLTQPLKPLPGGAVRVAWRTVSADGHPIEGQFTFTNAAAAPSSAAPPPSTPGAAPATVDSVGGRAWGVAGAVVLVVVLLLAGGALWWRRRTSAG